MSKEKTKLVLNQLVADLSQQAAIIHQVHWYMRGRGFLTLHPAMDKLMDQCSIRRSIRTLNHYWRSTIFYIT